MVTMGESGDGGSEVGVIPGPGPVTSGGGGCEEGPQGKKTSTTNGGPSPGDDEMMDIDDESSKGSLGDVVMGVDSNCKGQGVLEGTTPSVNVANGDQEMKSPEQEEKEKEEELLRDLEEEEEPLALKGLQADEEMKSPEQVVGVEAETEAEGTEEDQVKGVLDAVLNNIEADEENSAGDGEGGMIRIRDIGSLRDHLHDHEEDDDDDVVILPTEDKKKTQIVAFTDASDLLELDLECDSECTSVTVDENNVRLSPGKVHRKCYYQEQLIALRTMLVILENKGQIGLTLKTAANSIPAKDTSPGQGQGLAMGTVTQNLQNQVQVVRIQGGTGTSGSPVGRPITPGPHILRSGNQATAGAATGMGNNSSRSVTNSPVNLNQILFDPKSGLILCPAQNATTTQSAATATTASQQVISQQNQNQSPRGTAYRTVQATPEFLNAIRSGGGSGQQQLRVYNGTSSTAPMVPSPLVTHSTTYRAPSPSPTSQLQGQGARSVANAQAPVGVGTPPLRQYTPIAPKSLAGTPTTAAQRKLSPGGTMPISPSAIAIAATSTPAAAAAAATAANYRKNHTVNHQSNAAAQQQEEEKGGKTFPSLVVVVKPYLQDKVSKTQLANLRSELDTKVKSMLMHTPGKFTEWLLQKGLLRMNQKCPRHGTLSKLGIMSNSETGDKYASSGGYVFALDCCPGQELSIFQGSIFEASQYPPGTTLKLVYHWACQTPAASVIQWVKVTSYYLKNFYTLLRSVCVAALHEHAGLMGGRGKYVEIGVVTLGTMGSAASGKAAKLEIVGVFDPSAKSIRMRLLPVPVANHPEVQRRERLDAILNPIARWVHKDSVLLIDSTLDKGRLERMGFRSVNQNKALNVAPGAPMLKTNVPTNVNVMNYLRNIVPKMFQAQNRNTLTVLSRSLVQQFLDELSWRELWGAFPLRTFDNMIQHLVSMTKVENTGDLLIQRLNKISLNPFADWAPPQSAATMANTVAANQYRTPPASGSMMDCLPDSIVSRSLTELFAPPSARSPASLSTAEITLMGKNSVSVYGKNNKRKGDSDLSVDIQYMLSNSPKTYTLQTYYYVWCNSPMVIPVTEFPTNLKCPLCLKLLKNYSETLVHIIGHVLSPGRLNPYPFSCKYCLKELPNSQQFEDHIDKTHRLLAPFVCRICPEKFPTEDTLISHMWRRHVEAEAPYRCEICRYRTSFHTDVVDHFYKEHSTSGQMLCPMCLKTLPIRSMVCLKNVISHLQNHVLKKGKKCQDCCLVFSTDQEFRAHINENVHVSRKDSSFAIHELGKDITPIRMPKPPAIEKEVVPYPAQKKARTAGPNSSKGANNIPGVQTLNSSVAIPLNPGDKYMLTPMKVQISDVEMFGGMNCWECEKPINIAGHYRGMMKCSRCRFETCCTYTLNTHVKSHDAPELQENVVRMKLALAREADLTSDAMECKGCYFTTGSSRRLACHLLGTGHKACLPKNACDENGETGGNSKDDEDLDQDNDEEATCITAAAATSATATVTVTSPTPEDDEEEEEEEEDG